MFIQGLRPFSSLIPKSLKKHVRKGSYNYSNIIDNWTKIVNKEISDACYPASIKMGKNFKDGTLVLNVMHGKEIQIEYKKREIIDKINSFFGYSCISHVTLKIMQKKTISRDDVFPKIKNNYKIEQKKLKKASKDQETSLVKKMINRILNK